MENATVLRERVPVRAEHVTQGVKLGKPDVLKTKQGEVRGYPEK